jgi:RNA polymerase sigma-70 factor (ECF subfamily)
MSSEPTSEPTSEPSSENVSSEVLAVLTENHQRFLRFLQPRVGSREAAEEILQAAFVKSLERGDGLRDDESAVAWFYRLLRNATVDHYRRNATEARALERHALENPEAAFDPELEDAVCGCMKSLISTLKDEYARILRRVELEGASLAEAARAEDITANNATVRLHRARQALRKRLEQTCGACAEHGCLNCTCEH